MSHIPHALQEVAYEHEAQLYLHSLPLEHFMESTPQATQRKFMLESFEVLRERRVDVHAFNELLVQYLLRGQRKPGQVVPDNMVVISEEPIEAVTSYNVPLEPARPFWVMEYVSKASKREDYEESYRKYERELKVPYYLVFRADRGELTLYRHNKRKYVVVKANQHGRYPVKELEMEVGLLDGWVRFWYQGELLPLTAELQRALDAMRRQLTEAQRRADEAERHASQARQRTEEERQRAEEEKQRAEEERRRAEEERRRAEEERQRADALQKRAETAERALAALQGRST